MKRLLPWLLITLALPAAARCDEEPPYLGEWSNGRGETLVVTRRTLQFGEDKAVPYRDITKASDGDSFDLQITAQGDLNAFPGKYLRMECEEDSMEMTGFASYDDLRADENALSEATWYKDNAVGEGPKQARAKVYTPAPGSAERKAIALALHPPCERDLKQDVVLKFLQLNVTGDWAFAHVQPLQPNGEKIDYRGTRYREQVELGAFDPFGEALLRRASGKWRVLEWSFGGTDTAREEWLTTHRAPRALLH